MVLRNFRASLNMYAIRDAARVSLHGNAPPKFTTPPVSVSQNCACAVVGARGRG